MADELTYQDGTGARGQVVGNEGMAQVVNLGIGNAGDFEIAVDGSSDVSDK